MDGSLSMSFQVVHKFEIRGNSFLFLGVKGNLDVGFILDGSGSINKASVYNWDRLRWFIVNVISVLPELGTRVGVVVFGQTADVRIKLNEYHERYLLINAVRSLHYPDGHTNTSGGLYVARTQLFDERNGDRPNASNLAVLITDGVSNVDKEKTIPFAQDLHIEGIRMICIGIINGTGEDEIRAISSPPHLKDIDYFIRKDFYFPEQFISLVEERIKGEYNCPAKQ